MIEIGAISKQIVQKLAVHASATGEGRMSEIVERLRIYASEDHERLCQGREYTCSCGYDDRRDPLMTEAADEITRLEARVAGLEKALSDAAEQMEWLAENHPDCMGFIPPWPSTTPAIKVAAEKARAALNPSQEPA